MGSTMLCSTSRSRRSVRALLAAKPDKANIKTSDGYKEAAPESVEVGEFILIKPGEKFRWMVK